MSDHDTKLSVTIRVCEWISVLHWKAESSVIHLADNDTISCHIDKNTDEIPQTTKGKPRPRPRRNTHTPEFRKKNTKRRARAWLNLENKSKYWSVMETLVSLPIVDWYWCLFNIFFPTRGLWWCCTRRGKSGKKKKSCKTWCDNENHFFLDNHIIW